MRPFPPSEDGIVARRNNLHTFGLQSKRTGMHASRIPDTCNESVKWESQRKSKSGNGPTNYGSRTTGPTDGMMSSGIRPRKN